MTWNFRLQDFEQVLYSYGILSGQLLALQLQELPGTNYAMGPGRMVVIQHDSPRLYRDHLLGERRSLQAQPTWTHWSFPFVSRWLTAKMKGPTVAVWQKTYPGHFASKYPVNFVPGGSLLLSVIAIRYKQLRHFRCVILCIIVYYWLCYVVGVFQFPVS